MPDTTPATSPAPPAEGSATASEQSTQIASSQQSTEVADLVDQLVKPQYDFDPATIRKGVISAVDATGTPPTVDLNISGDSTTTISSVRFLDSYSPVVGDTVLIIKQGTDIVVLGQITDGSTGEDAGWQTPTPSSGFTNNGNNNGNSAFRLIVDNGDLKVQWKGSVAHTGSNTTIFAATQIPELYRPASARTMLVARDPGGGSNVAQVTFGTDGTVVLAGPTTVPTMSGGGTSSSAGSHTHEVYDSHDHSHSGNTTETSFADSGTSDPGGHTHTVPASTATVTAPTYLVFNGVEYFL